MWRRLARPVPHLRKQSRNRLGEGAPPRLCAILAVLPQIWPMDRQNRHGPLCLVRRTRNLTVCWNLTPHRYTWRRLEWQVIIYVRSRADIHCYSRLFNTTCPSFLSEIMCKSASSGSVLVSLVFIGSAYQTLIFVQSKAVAESVCVAFHSGLWNILKFDTMATDKLQRAAEDFTHYLAT